MEKIKVKIKGKEYQVEKGTPLGKIFEIAGIEGTLGGVLNGKIIDLQTPIKESGEIHPVYRGSRESLEIMRHSL
ncbi:MAG TPA: threonine--tRNA ligase, partial [Aquificaceae bacterium]|nr:threonine--tRNA ligase [Aquificaceae bacterium]